MIKKIFLFWLAMAQMILFAETSAKATMNNVKIEYSPKITNGTIVDADIENGICVKNIYINVPDGKTDIQVNVQKSEKATLTHPYGTADKLFETEYTYAGRQKVMRIKIYPIFKNKNEYFIREKIVIAVSFEKPMFRRSKVSPLYAGIVNAEFVSEGKSDDLSESIEIKSFVMIRTDETGIYKIGYSDLINAGIDISMISPLNIGLYTPKKKTIPKDTSEMFPYRDPQKTPFMFVGNSDNRFDKDEYILFFGESVYGYGKNMYGDYDLYNNPFTDENSYMLVFNETAQIRMSNPLFVFDGIEKDAYAKKTMHYDSINPLLSGYGWVWKKFNMIKDSADAEYSIPFTVNALADSNADISLSFFYQTDFNDSFDIDVYLNDSYIGRASSRGAYKTVPLSFNFKLSNLKLSNVLKITGVNSDNRNKVFYLCEAAVVYSPDINESKNLSLYNYEGEVLKIAPKTDSYIYYKNENGFHLGKLMKGAEYAVNTESSEEIFLTDEFMNPSSIKKIDNNRMYQEKLDYDIIVITGDGMSDGASPYVQYRKSQGLNVGVYEIDDIYNAFSLGIETPVAVKAFLYYGYKHWSKFPEFLILLGSGSYDYKNRQNTYENRNVVPLYENGYGVYELALLTASRSQCIDRWFTQLTTGDSYIDIIPGRIVSMNADESRLALMKVIDYETKTPAFVKNRAMIIADDEYSSRTSGDYNDFSFTEDSETLAGYLGMSFNIIKLYLMDFWGDLQTSEHWTTNPGYKRDVRFVFKDILNEGVGFGFFYGHGSYYTITHEHILLYPDDIDLFTNLYRYPIFLFGTCQAGQCDNDYGAIAAEFQKLPYSGFSATIASTRAISGDESVGVIFSGFTDDLMSGGFNTIGEYYLSLINEHFYTGTSHQLFGDPSMVVKKYDYETKVLSPETLLLGSYNSIGYDNPSADGYTTYLDVYQPSYIDSHDYKHTFPYAYTYYSKTDGELAEISENVNRKMNDIYLADSLSIRNYLTKTHITTVSEDDSAVYLGIKKPVWIFSSSDSNLQDSFFIIVKCNGIAIKDSAVLPLSYTVDFEIKSSIGVYQGNVSALLSKLNIKNATSSVVYPTDMIEKDGTTKFSLNIASEDKMDTLILTVYGKDAQKHTKTVYIKHNAKIKTMNSFLIYPNPADSIIYLTFNSNGGGYLKWSIYDREGNRRLYDEERFLNGYNQIKTDISTGFNGSKIENGIYLIKAEFHFYQKEETVTETKKVIKK